MSGPIPALASEPATPSAMRLLPSIIRFHTSNASPSLRPWKDDWRMRSRRPSMPPAPRRMGTLRSNPRISLIGPPWPPSCAQCRRGAFRLCRGAAGGKMDFDTMAEVYDVIEPWYEHFYAALHGIVRSALALPAGAGRLRALDAGCGTGFQTAILEELGYQPHGLDLSGGLLAVARQRLPKVPLVRGTIERLPYASGSFDVVACCGSTLSFVDHAEAALTELGRVLRRGGVLLVDCEHRGRVDLAWALLDSLTGDRLGYGLTPRQAW